MYFVLFPALKNDFNNFKVYFSSDPYNHGPSWIYIFATYIYVMFDDKFCNNINLVFSFVISALFIHFAKEYNLKIRIYLLLFSPIIIILYIPIIVIYFIWYGIFLSINDDHTKTWLPNLFTFLNGRHCTDYYIDEFLIDASVLEKIRDVLYFVKKCWNFNSVKFLKKIKLINSYNSEIMFFILIQILDISTLSIILIIINIIRIPLHILFTIKFVLFISFLYTLLPIDFLLNKYVKNSYYTKYSYLILIILYTLFFTPFIFFIFIYYLYSLLFNSFLF